VNVTKSCLYAVAVLLAWSRCAPAQSGAESADSADSRLEFLNETFSEFALSRESLEPFPSSKPLLRYTNPVRNSFSDGTTYLWLDSGRPIGAGTISIRGDGAVWSEFTSLSKTPLECTQDGRPIWTPAAGNLVDQPLENGPVAAPAARLRLIQFRRLARRFSVIMSDSAQDPDNVQTLRMLDEPIHSWPQEKPAVGALFSFCETTDPEGLLRLEYDEEDRAWTFSFSRMTSRPLTVRLDEREILSVTGYWANPRSPQDPYIERWLGRYDSLRADREVRSDPGQ